MTRLADDCFTAPDAVLSVEAAAALIAGQVPVVAGPETVPLAQGDGRVAAADVIAAHALPPFDNSAVDGYALRTRDLAPDGPTRLPVAGRLPAGTAPAVLAPGTACRIFTGAPIPAGADAVVMQEDARPGDGFVTVPPGLVPGANRRRAGEDLPAGAVVIPAGRRLGPADLALAAAAGHGSLVVRRRLRVALFSTGDELREPGTPLGPGAIADSNRVLLAALLRRLGAAVSDLGILRDDPAALPGRLRAAARDHDVVLTSGGVSVGEEDHVKAAVAATGRLTLWRVAIKPGRPLAVGGIGEAAFVGLPGNPVAAYVTLLVVVRPLLARLAGEDYRPPPPQMVRAAFCHDKRAGRREYLRVGLRRAGDGAVEAVLGPSSGSGALAALAGSDGLADLPEAASAVREGDPVAVYPHALLW
ncbi:gephyrin-like molybdotransferase Glp [Methylobacterium oryzihabitans]|uniref:Molybdopterin molybdenumtransferase n=1 Tax=Methylobacterium oryzihabitans TaxID=2499852 RepID=A0A437PD65_9HYPH|nr:gephyrin-like molybdotransferase Glp [Methylobacterium oryzihabitans]RVU20216.1 molybdopterin molybdenumtransferase MoeA [Methylobacterium oryzihabitans]